jgi:hypothetical protein
MLIQGYLENNATTIEIELAFAAVCEVAPQSLQQACNNFVLNTLPILLQDLTEGKTAEQACADVGACTGHCGQCAQAHDEAPLLKTPTY